MWSCAIRAAFNAGHNQIVVDDKVLKLHLILLEFLIRNDLR